jgi:multiple sugar transport system permease protein
MIQSRKSLLLYSILLLSPSLVVLFLTLLFPSFWAFILSFFDYQLGMTKEFAGFANYRKILVDGLVFWQSLLKTGIMTIFIVVGELLLGIGFALLLSRKIYRFQKLLVAIIIAPMAVSPVVGVTIWKYMLAPNFGIINYVLTLLGIQNPNWFVDPTFVFIAIGLIDIWMCSPFVFTIIYPSILSIDPTLHEAALIDGATYVQRLRYIVFPLISPAIITTTIFRIINALRLFSPVWLFAQGGPFGSSKVLSIYLYEQAFSYYRFGFGSAVAWLLLIITFVISLPQMRAMQKILKKDTY